ncbi:MAG: hypothetical protein Q8K66_05620 [Sediminibacterium sp.]|nr:hypothetical protein [Sediminibacterium sp.]
MIHKTDLRIGNLILNKQTNSVFEVTSLGVDDLVVCEYKNPSNSGITTYDSIVGIPFSRQNLNDSKWFEKDGEPNYYIFWGNNPAVTGPIEGLLNIEFPYDNSTLARVWTHYDSSKEHKPGTATTMEYWHQLENFVFALTGKEIKSL